jgi:hypothetical protein
MQKYVVFLQENRAEVVSEEFEREINEPLWSTDRMLLEKTGADMIVWACDEKEAVSRATSRWRRFDNRELNELWKAVKTRYDMATEFAQEDYIYDISTLYHELKEVLEQIEEEQQLNRKRYYAVKADDLPF